VLSDKTPHGAQVIGAEVSDDVAGPSLIRLPHALCGRAVPQKTRLSLALLTHTLFVAEESTDQSKHTHEGQYAGEYAEPDPESAAHQ
jgi:hypothetical protein